MTALYGSLFAQEGEGAFRRFQENFRRGTVLGLILGAIGLVLDFQLMGQLEGRFALVKYLLYLAALCWAGVSTFAFGLAARFQDRPSQSGVCTHLFSYGSTPISPGK